jgi:hypothetical protein
VYALIGTGYTSLEECVDGCGACIQGSGTPTSVEFETFTIPDALQVFDKCNDPSLSNAIIDTGPLSTQGTPYVAGDLDICPECLAICVTASGVGTAWWFKAYDALGGLVFSEAGGYEGNTPACFGQSCNTTGYNLTHSTSGALKACDGYSGYDLNTYTATLTFSNGLVSNKFDWISPYDANHFTGYDLYTAKYEESAIFDNVCDAFTCSRFKARNWIVLCSGNIVWDLTGIAASGKDFTYTDVEGNSETRNYADWSEDCIAHEGTSITANCNASCVPPYYFNINPTYPTFPS